SETLSDMNWSTVLVALDNSFENASICWRFVCVIAWNVLRIRSATNAGNAMALSVSLVTRPIWFAAEGLKFDVCAVATGWFAAAGTAAVWGWRARAVGRSRSDCQHMSRRHSALYDAIFTRSFVIASRVSSGSSWNAALDASSASTWPCTSRVVAGTGDSPSGD